MIVTSVIEKPLIMISLNCGESLSQVSFADILKFQINQWDMS
jgi:hypothetical protein